MVLLTSDLLEVICSERRPRALTAKSLGTTSELRRTVHLIIDLLAFNVALLSLGLCLVALVRSIKLWNVSTTNANL